MITLDLFALALDILPQLFGKPIWKALVFAFTSSTQPIQDKSEILYASAEYELKFSGRTISFEDYLNDQFDNTLRRIRIKDGTRPVITYLFNVVEGNEDLYLYNDGEPDEELVYLFNEEELDEYTDFIVEVPASLSYNEQRLISIINIFRLPGMVYQIVEV